MKDSSWLQSLCQACPGRCTNGSFGEEWTSVVDSKQAFVPELVRSLKVVLSDRYHPE